MDIGKSIVGLRESHQYVFYAMNKSVIKGNSQHNHPTSPRRHHGQLIARGPTNVESPEALAVSTARGTPVRSQEICAKNTGSKRRRHQATPRYQTARRDKPAAAAVDPTPSAFGE